MFTVDIRSSLPYDRGGILWRKVEYCRVFKGSSHAGSDAKGRLKVPNAFRPLLKTKYGRELYLTSLTGEYVRIYPMPVWLEIEEKLGQMPSAHPSRMRVLDRIKYFR